MSEADAIEGQAEPFTAERLVEDLRSIGLRAGDSVIVHSSLSRIGWVCGGPVAVIEALRKTVTPDGLVVVPTQSGELSEPSKWKNPPVPESWWQSIRDHMPAFDPDQTPTRGMGAIPETFRKYKDVVRSYHPTSSFAVWGKGCTDVIATQTLDNPYGMDSPLGKLYERDGKVLLIGVGHDSNTTIHLAETLVPAHPTTEESGPIMVGGQRRWATYNVPAYEERCEEDFFPELGAAFESAHPCTLGAIGRSTSRLMRVRPLVDFAAAWIAEHVNVR